jgi:hypothetical protein
MNTKLFAVLAAGVLGATVAQANSVESANIVGYQQVTVPTGYSLFTVTFKNVDNGEYDLQNIVPYQNGAIYAVNNKVVVQKMDTAGAYLQTYNYRQGKGGWCKSLTFVGNGVVTFKDGEAMCVNNTTGAPIQLQVSGQVSLEPWSYEIPTGYSLIGNMTPAEIDMQDIIPYDLNGQVIAVNNKVVIQKMDSTGAYLQTYNYRQGKGGWCKSLTYAGTGVLVFAPGEAACINNQTGAPIKLKFKSPIAAQ